jgi:tripartite-type tricarboxylate transporter receptor subunit TctC
MFSFGNGNSKGGYVMKRAAKCILIVVAIFIASAANAQSYPSKPIRFIVGFAPGGATDIIARALAQKLADAFGQQVVVDNRAGGGGTIAAMMAAKAPADGYTMLMGTISTLATNVSTYKNLPYDPLRDFAPVTLAATTPYFVTVNAGLPAATLKDFIALAKAKPGQMNFGTSGAGGGAHLSVELFRAMAGIDLVHIPYKGAALALTDVIAGQIQMSFSQPLIVLPHLKTGRVRALAITSAKRSTALPEFPTIAESGVPGYESSSWQGVVVPTGTPAAIVSRLHAELVKGLRSRDIGDRLAAEGTDPGGNSPAEFGAYIRREIAKWAKVVKDAGIKTE